MTTFDDWKAALIPLGWVEYLCCDDHYIESPASSGRNTVYLWLLCREDCLELQIWNDAGDPYAPDADERRSKQRWITLDVPPDIDTMRALMVGLQIPCKQKEVE